MIAFKLIENAIIAYLFSVDIRLYEVRRLSAESLLHPAFPRELDDGLLIAAREQLLPGLDFLLD